MIKLLPIGVLIFLVVLAGGYLWMRRSQAQVTPQIKELTQLTGQTDVSSFAPVDNSDRIKILEEAVILLAKKINGEVPTTGTNATLIGRISTLEDKVTSLQRQVSQLQSGVSPTSAPAAGRSVKQPPIYIPLGWVASSSVMVWTTITTQSITIDTNDYPGFTSAQFEARIVNFQGNGTAYARLINTTDGSGVLASEVSNSGIDYAWVTSSNFSLASGKKTYAVQLKTNTGYAAQISDAHLKINF